MFNVKWDQETNGILLVSEKGDINGTVRPVFFEELDLLKFSDRGFSYPKTEEPILWAVGRFYYYQGDRIAKVEKGGFFDEVNVKVYKNNIGFQPTNVEKMIEKNEEKILFYSHDSIDFIRDISDKYKNKVDVFAASFSGGKDSVALVDLLKRSLSSDDFILIFADTRLESQFTYEYIQEFAKENSDFKFDYAKFDEDQIKMWEKLGPPSRINRWCHTVYKTAPIRKKIKELLNTDTPKVLLFDGIRSEESYRRSKYDSVQSGTKGMLQINISPILNWTAYEVFLYLFKRKLKINKMYRYGFSRVGCVMCPYSSKWAEYLSSNLFSEEIKPYISHLKQYSQRGGIKDIEKYISDGGWKSRSGGLYLENGGNRSNFSKIDDDFEIITSKGNGDFLEWIKTVGKFVKNKNGGELLFEGNIFPIKEKKLKNGFKYEIKGIKNNYTLPNLLKKISYKSSYCARCGACESVCPTGALEVTGNVKVSLDKCTHCKSCLNYVEKGCWVAKSISYVGTGSVKNMKTKGMSRYQTFGLREEWMPLFFVGDDWLIEGPSNNLGNIQIESMKCWLKDAEFWDGKPTKIGTLFCELKDSTDKFMWCVIWNNLAEKENSPLINWYVLNINPGIHSKNDLIEAVAKYNSRDIPNRTDKNAISSLIQLLKESLIGSELNQGKEFINGKTKLYEKNSSQNIPDMAIIYSIYRYSEKKGRKGLVLEELLKNKEVSPATLFSLDFEELKSALVKASSKYPDLIEIEFSGNLDNIKLKDDISSFEIIKHYVEEKKSGIN